MECLGLSKSSASIGHLSAPFHFSHLKVAFSDAAIASRLEAIASI